METVHEQSVAPARSLGRLPAEADGRVHVPELDGLRGIAILMVLVYHFDPIGGGSHGGAMKVLSAVLGAGWIGVDLFFVLSGFLITGILLRHRSSPHRFRNFYGRRSLRIFPLYYLVLVVYFGIVPLVRHLMGTGHAGGGATQLWYWLYASNLAPALGYNSGQVGLTHFWSLAVEEQYYLVWPWLVFVVGGRWLPGVAVLAMGVSAASKVWCIRHHVDPYAIQWFTPCRIETLALGSALAAWVGGRPRRGKAPVFVWLFALAGVTVVGITAVRHLFGGWDPVVQLVGFPVLAVLFASAVGLAISLDHGGPYRKVLRLPTLAWLARYSYGIYVFHYLLQNCVLPSADKWKARVGPAWLGGGSYLVVGVASSLVLAYLSYHCYEKHFLRLKRLFPG